MLEFIGKLLAVTLAVNFTIAWTSLMLSSVRKTTNPWPDRENLP